MKYILTSICLSLLLTCASHKATKDNKCPKIYKNDFKEILHEKYKTVYNNDTIAFNEIRFECVYSPFSTHKVMYDKYGKWNREIFPSNSKHPILVWENIDVFSNGKKYTILTNGLEEWKYVYASVMVFDENETDQLSDTSPVKVSLTNFFADLIQNNNSENEEFYEIYGNLIHPKQPESIN
ncbi:hypothetical protein [Mangrovimonas sp. TPBH4]|uniref:hypothetical protein n=1 Tax=Mangrovimonas sp. TPBH4 TaxID=1645914 RepID=UPI0006B51245|nr:hypothetical protein [Mangrovimonas sp. TPBH4]